MGQVNVNVDLSNDVEVAAMQQFLTVIASGLSGLSSPTLPATRKPAPKKVTEPEEEEEDTEEETKRTVKKAAVKAPVKKVVKKPEPEEDDEEEEDEDDSGITVDQIRDLVATKSREGFKPQLKAWMEKKGATSPSNLDAKHYEACVRFANSLVEDED